MGFTDKRFCISVSDALHPKNDSSRYCDQLLAVCMNENSEGEKCQVTAIVGGDLIELLMALLDGEIGEAMEDAAREIHMKHLPWFCRFLRRDKKKRMKEVNKQ